MTAEQAVEYFKNALAEKWGYIFGQSGAMWTESDQKQKVNYMVKNFGSDWKKSADAKANKYYNSAKLGSKWIGHRVADCSGMFVGLYRKYGLSIAHVSTTIYTQYCGKKGKLTDSLKKTLLPGTAVFTGDTESNHPHVGLYVGNGKVIEAMGVDAGVVTSNLTASKWKWYGQLKTVDYGAETPEKQPSPAEPDKLPTNNLPTLKKGSTGEYVTLLQSKLKNKGYDLGKYGVDGDFGSATLAAVKAFQKDNGLEVDGIVGKKTWEKLMENTQAVLWTVTIPNLTEKQADTVLSLYKGSYKEKQIG